MPGGEEGGGTPHRGTFVSGRVYSLLLGGPLGVGIGSIFRPGQDLLWLLVLPAFFWALRMTWFGWLVGWLMEFGSGTNLGMYGYVGCFVVGPPPHLAALLGPCLARRREKINHFNWRAKHTSPFK